MVGDGRKGGRMILTNVVYGWFHGGQSLANTAQGYRQDSDGTYYGRMKVSLNDDPKTQMVVYFHTDNPDNPQWGRFENSVVDWCHTSQHPQRLLQQTYWILDGQRAFPVLL